MRWTYYIDEGIKITPKNTRQSEVKTVLENSNIRAYRTTPPENIPIVSPDYAVLKNLEANRRHEKFNFEMHNEGVKHCGGEFTINDFAGDDYKSVGSVKITARDAYTEIQENEDIEVNVIADRTELTIGRYSRWHFFLTQTTGNNGSDSEEDGFKYLFSQNISLFGVYVNLFVTELIEVDKYAEVPTGFISTPFADLGDYKIYKRFPVNFPVLNYVQDWFNAPDLSDFQWSAAFLGYHVPWDETLFNLYKVGPDVRGKEIDATNFWLRKSIYNNRANKVFDQVYSGMTLRGVLTRILTTSCPNFTGSIKSGVLFNDPAETGKSFPESYPFPTPGYEKYLIEMSDFRRPNAYEAATKGILTFRQALDYFCGKKQLKWSLDVDGNIRIEHIDYYLHRDVGTVISDQNTTNKYYYKQNEKPNRDALSESSGWNEDFDKIEVLYGTVPALNGMKESKTEIALSRIYTDVDGLNSHLSDLSDDGFVYIDAALEETPGGSGHVKGAILKGAGFKSGEANLQNVDLSNANCLNTYYRHDAFQQTFQIGGREVSAISLKRMKVQDIVFKGDEIPDCEKLLVTRFGSGIIESLSYHPTEEYSFKATVLYE